ncbi:MAG: methyltransferase [Clostridia bacterium]|nr:methyltransferase [Clostridia bacterium]
MRKLTREEIAEMIGRPNGAEKLAGMNVDKEHLLGEARSMFIEEGAASALILRLLNRKQAVIRLSGDEEFLEAVRGSLCAESPKLRRNAARLISALKPEGFVPDVINALRREEQRFVRPAMLLALGSLGTPEAAEFLNGYSVAPAADETERKHFIEETEALELAGRSLMPKAEHEFTGLPEGRLAELRAPDLLTGQLADELEELGFTVSDQRHDSLKTTVSDLASLFEARCFTEVLFPIGQVSAEAGRIASASAGFIYDFMRSSHSGEPPFRFRVEAALSVPEGKFDRRTFVKETALAVERASKGMLANSPSDYEAELRIEGNERTARLFLKLFTVKDGRFAYRADSIPASMNPAVAAAVLRLAQDHLSVNARVIDPCCGSGTFLIERGLMSPCRSLTGVDISHRAIDIARRNTGLAGVNAKYTVNDILRFECHRPYDELISNLPFGNRVGDHSSCERLYKGLLEKLPQLVKKGGVAVLYTMEFTLLKRLIREQGQRLTILSQQRTEAGGLTPMIFILRVN